MKSILWVVGCIVVVIGGLSSCGGPECGPGTTENDGTCVPVCGPGTTLANDRCEPDGSTICAQGTKYNPETSTCEVDPSACAAGTALVNGMCVPEDDTLAADLQEAAEPNDTTGAGQFAVPALNAATTIHGCITPSNGTRDVDPWIVTSTGPALLEITADGVHGLAAGFAVFDASDNALLANWQRLGVNLTGDTSKRQVFLPAAGAYVLLMDDSRSLILGAAAGGTNTCYFGTIKNVPLPATTALTVPTTTGSDTGDATIYTFDATATGDILDITQTTTSTSMSPSFVVMRNDVLSGVGVGDSQSGTPPFWTAGGLSTTGDQVKIIIDNEYNYGLTPQPYTLDMFHIAAQALSTNGSAVTVTKHNGAYPTAPWWDRNYLYFDVATAGQIVHFNLTSSVGVRMMIVRRDIFTPAGAFDVVANINSSGTAPTTFNGQYVRFLQPGRYYFVTLDPAGVNNATYTITSTLTNMATAAVTYGTPMTAQALTAQGSTFFTLDTQAAYEWLEFGVPAAANWGAGQARITVYDLAGGGWLGSNYLALQTNTQPVDGSAPFGRIVMDDARDYLIRVEDTTAPGTGPTFTLDVKERAHTNLGTIVAGTPINRTGMDALPANGTLRYLIKGTAGNQLSAQFTPSVSTADIRIDRRSALEAITATADGAGAGGAETLVARFGTAPTWIGFTVTNKTANATNHTVALTATPPLPYADICPTGTVLPAPFNGTADDEFAAAQTLPAGYSFYGSAVSNIVVAANGLVAFGTTDPVCSPAGCYLNAAIPATAQPNNFIAGYWSDLAGVKVCRKDGASTVTLQWTGTLYGSTTKVEFQVVLHQTGAVDFIYGPNHQASGGAATVGVENAAGTGAQQLVFNTAGAVPPSSSFSVTTP